MGKMANPRSRKILLVAGVVVALMALPFALRLAWLEFGPPYVDSSDTAKQVDKLTSSFVSESQAFQKTVSSSWFPRHMLSFLVIYFFCSPSTSRYSDCFLTLGKRAPESEAGLNALLMASSIDSRAHGEEAFSLLVRYHPDDNRLSRAVHSFMYNPDVSSVQKLASATHSHLVAAAARYVLGCNAQTSNQNVEAKSELQKAMEEIKQVDASSVARPEETPHSHFLPGIVPLDRLRKDIETALYETTYLQAGCLAPEIEGLIQDGTTVRLSDFRKKVIFLDFWGDW
jgi:hypothetical protein